jgi:phosphoglycolate phosphatase
VHSGTLFRECLFCFSWTFPFSLRYNEFNIPPKGSVFQVKKYILFDLDGTVSDPKEGITKAVRYALNHYGIDVNSLDELEPFIGPPLREAYAEFYGFDAAQAEEAVAVYREYYADRGLYENTLYPGMDALLKDLSEKATVVLATCKPTPFARKALDYFGLTQYFDLIVGAEFDGTRGEKIEVMTYALELLGSPDVADCVMVGDRKFDMLSSCKLGMDCIGVSYGYGSREELQAAGAGIIVDSVAALREALQ